MAAHLKEDEGPTWAGIQRKVQVSIYVKQRFKSVCASTQADYTIGAASANSAEFRGIRPWIHTEDLL